MVKKRKGGGEEMSENSKVRLFFKILRAGIFIQALIIAPGSILTKDPIYVLISIVLLLYLRCEDIWDEVEKLAKKLE